MKKNKIPKFKTIAEEALFWDSHDVTEYARDMGKTNVFFPKDKPREKTLTIRIEPSLKEKIAIFAHNHGVSLSTFVRMGMVDKLRQIESQK